MGPLMRTQGYVISTVSWVTRHVLRFRLLEVPPPWRAESNAASHTTSRYLLLALCGKKPV